MFKLKEIIMIGSIVYVPLTEFKRAVDLLIRVQKLLDTTPLNTVDASLLKKDIKLLIDNE